MIMKDFKHFMIGFILGFGSVLGYYLISPSYDKPPQSHIATDPGPDVVVREPKE